MLHVRSGFSFIYLCCYDIPFSVGVNVSIYLLMTWFNISRLASSSFTVSFFFFSLLPFFAR